MKPCSVSIVNVLRDTVFICASLAGVQSLNYIGNREYYGVEVENTSTKTLFLTMFATNVTFVCIGTTFYTHTACVTPCRNDRILHIHSAQCQISDRPYFPRSRVASIQGRCSASSRPRTPHITHTEVFPW